MRNKVWVGSGLLCMAAVVLCASGMAFAQQSPLDIENIPRIVGIGVGAAPDYLGSSDYRLVAAPFFRYQFSTTARYLTLRATELDLNVINHPWCRFGPVLNLRPGRDDVENDQVDRMDEIDTTADAGIFVGAEFIDGTNTRARLLVSLQYLHDVGGVYNGYIATGSVRGWYPISRALDVTMGLSSSYGSASYMDTYFGVGNADSARSGLQRFSPGSGFRDVSLTPGVVLHLSNSWHLGVGVRYMRLLSDAADSPVTQVGSKDQFIGGVGLAYSW
jgi:MipA family protein